MSRRTRRMRRRLHRRDVRGEPLTLLVDDRYPGETLEALVWGICRWDSVGHDAGGGTFDRPGRATVILVRRDGTLKALHTHFSLVPRPVPASPAASPPG